MLVVIDLNISNLSSLLNSLDYLKIAYKVSSKGNDIKKASALILPGVGTFEAGMESLEKNGLIGEIQKAVLNDKKPILGICLGMQMFFSKSEESPGAKGLSILQGEVVRLPKSADYTIPRIGWAESRFLKDFLIFKAGEAADFYYIHSFFAKPADKSAVAIVCEKNDVTGGVCKGNIFGCQFHPEKSHKVGLRILQEFSKFVK